MTLRRAILLSGIASLAAFCTTPAQAQDTADVDTTPDEALDEDNEILVLAQRLRGDVDVPEPPIAVLEEADIAAYGASSIADLISQLSPQAGSGRGRGGGQPVFLVNGMRVSGFRELRSYPPEAIRKIEILPEETAQRFGYSANQRLINILLKDDYSSTEVEREYGQPWDGGYWSGELNATYLRINGASRLNLNGEIANTASLTEAEREIVEPDSLIPTVASDPDPATERTLVDGNQRYDLEGTYTIALGEGGGSLALNASVEKTHSKSRDGFNLATLVDPGSNTELRVVNPDDPIVTKNDVLTSQVGASLNHRLGDWDFSATLNGSIVQTDTDSDRRLDTSGLIADAMAGAFPIDGTLPVLPSAGVDLASSTSRNLDSQMTFIGRPLLLPAGELTATAKAGYSLARFESSDTRNPGIATALGRDTLNGGINLGVPLTSRREGFLDAIGDISLTFSAGISDLSDFGSLKDWSAGVTWSPTEKLGLQASYIYDEAAPGLTQLGNPTVVREGVPVYDFTNGQTVFIQSISGGNPDLTRETRRDVKLSANWELPVPQGGRLVVEYFNNRSRNVAAGFPSVLTPDIEAAFPGRVTRDAGGKLVSVDVRPVTFARQDSKRLRIGFNFSGPFGKAREEQAPPSPAPAPAPAAAESRPPFDPSRFAAMRQRMCAAPEPGATQDQAEPDLSGLPEPLLARLQGPDGKVDPERLAAFRARVCSQEGPPAGAGQGQQGGQAPQIAEGGPPAGARGPGGPGAGGPPSGGRGPGGPPVRLPGFGGGGDGRGRLFVNLFHTIELANEVLIAEGLPVLDLLDGDAISGGGTVRHSTELQGGMFYNGMGMRISGRYSGPSRIDGTGLPGSSNLRFGSLATLDLRLFVDLGRQQKLVEKAKFFKGSRVSFQVQNIFDSHRKVTDETGSVPLRYQPGLVDPVGRYIEIEFRKMF